MKTNLQGDKLKGDSAPGSPHPTAASPGRWRAGTHRGNSQGPTFPRSFINQNGPRHKKQGPFPQKYDFAKRKSCWLRGCIWWKIFVWFFFPFFFFSFSSFLFAANFFLRQWVFVFFYKTLALKDSNTIQTMAINPHPWGPSQAGGSETRLGFFVAVFLASGAGGQVRGPGVGGICTAVPGRWSQERIHERDNN